MKPIKYGNSMYLFLTLRNLGGSRSRKRGTLVEVYVQF